MAVLDDEGRAPGAKPEETADGQGEAKLDHLFHQVELLACLPPGEMGLRARADHRRRHPWLVQ